MSKKDPRKNKVYVIKKTGGYIVVVEGAEERHLEYSDPDPEVKEIIRKLEVLLQARKAAGLEISDLFIKKLGVFGSANFATHTTGAGDYDAQKQKKRKKK